MNMIQEWLFIDPIHEATDIIDDSFLFKNQGKLFKFQFAFKKLKNWNDLKFNEF